LAGIVNPMVSVPSPESRLRVRGVVGWGFDGWVVDIPVGRQALSELLAACQGFLVDDHCGREVGVVEDVVVGTDSQGPMRLLVVQGWGRRRIAVSVEDVIEVDPGGRRLVALCRSEHLPRTMDAVPRRSGGAGATAVLFSLLALLTGRRKAARLAEAGAGDQGSMRPRRIA
jgi:hypothetical protein